MTHANDRLLSPRMPSRSISTPQSCRTVDDSLHISGKKKFGTNAYREPRYRRRLGPHSCTVLAYYAGYRRSSPCPSSTFRLQAEPTPLSRTHRLADGIVFGLRFCYEIHGTRSLVSAARARKGDRSPEIRTYLPPRPMFVESQIRLPLSLSLTTSGATASRLPSLEYDSSGCG
jgi:hypothetical protein